MRALTVQQPWASAIVDGYKTVENRSSGFTLGYRGRLLIHAGMRWSDRGANDPRIIDAYGETLPEFPSGAVLGWVEVVDAHPASGCCAPWGETSYAEAGGREVLDVVHLLLEAPVKLARPIAMKGALGLWKPTQGLVAAVTAAAA